MALIAHCEQISILKLSPVPAGSRVYASVIFYRKIVMVNKTKFLTSRKSIFDSSSKTLFSAETSDSRKYRLNQHKLPVPGQCHKILSLYPTSNASAERASLGFAFKRNAWWGVWVKDINNSLHLAQKYARIFLPRTLSVPRGEQFSKSVNCELWVRNRWLIFAPNRGYIVLCL